MRPKNINMQNFSVLHKEKLTGRLRKGESKPKTEPLSLTSIQFEWSKWFKSEDQPPVSNWQNLLNMNYKPTI